MDDFSSLPDDVQSNMQHAILIDQKIKRLEETRRQTLEALGESIARHRWDLDQAADLFTFVSRYPKMPFLRTACSRSGWNGQKIAYFLKERETQEEMGLRYIPTSGVHAVYVLMMNGVVVYVGRSRNVRQRLKNHRRNNIFDDYEVYICESLRESKDLEAVLQQQHRPLRNIRIEQRPR